MAPVAVMLNLRADALTAARHGQNSRAITSALVAVKYKGTPPNVQSVCCSPAACTSLLRSKD